VVKHPKVVDHVGLLFNEPLGTAELFFIEPSDNLNVTAGEAALQGAATPLDTLLYDAEWGKQWRR
jgi:hypothetical protein